MLEQDRDKEKALPLFPYLPIADRAHSLLRVVVGDGGLVDEHVLLGVVPVNEAVAALHVEPPYHSADLGGDDLFLLLLDLFEPAGGFNLGMSLVGDPVGFPP